MLPRIVIHIEVSVDGRIDWLTPDLAQFYGLAARWHEDATLAGSETILRAEEQLAAEPATEDVQATRERDSRPLLVVPDSRGRIHTWAAWRAAGFWRDVVALVSASTPQGYLAELAAHGVAHLLAGNDRVDLRAALEEVNHRYGVAAVRVDSGGTLNGVLLREGLVSEVSVLVNPTLVGGTSPRGLFRAPDLTSGDGVIPVRLADCETLPNDYVWLRYEVVRPA